MRRHLIRNIFNHLFRRAWWQPNRESRKMLRKEADELIGWDKEVNPAWAKTWKYFIKRQVPWYGLIELNQFKIIEMRDYMQHHSWLCEEENKKQIKQMTEVIDLGKKILADEYEMEAHKFHGQHNVPISIIMLHEKDGDGIKFKEVTKLYKQDMFIELFKDLNICEDEYSQEISEFVKDKDTRTVDEWLKDNNLTHKDITVAYSSTWTKEGYDKIWTDMLAEAWQDRKNDINKYFECIAEYYESWGD